VAPPPIISITGGLVALGPMRRDLVPSYARWFNDFGTLRTLGANPLPRSLEAMLGLYERLSAPDTFAEFTIYERTSLRPIGITEWQEIDYRQGTANYLIFIGELENRGKGYGTEVTRLIPRYAFTTLGLRNVALRVYEYNLAGLRAYEKAGFRTIGRQRQCHWLANRFWDAIHMECLADEYLQSNRITTDDRYPLPLSC
jgi:RimJ/RimL family protein N-acetyltransferase